MASESFVQRYCYQKGDPEVGSCLTPRNELSEETHLLTKQKILLGRDTQVESSRVGEPSRTALPCVRLAVSGFMVMGLALGVVSGQPSCLCPYLV